MPRENYGRMGLIALLLSSVAATAALSEMGSLAFAQQEHTEFAANLAYIRGHLDQALANRQAGNLELAAAHAGHPVHEVYSLIEAELTENDPELGEQLEQGLTNLANEIADLTPEQVQTEVAELVTLLDRAESAVIGEAERNDAKFNAMVAIAVLETAEREYQEAVDNGQIVEMVEYQDSTAFIDQAKGIFESIEAGMPEEEAEEVSEFFKTLDSLTGSNADFEDVETAIGAIVHEFEEVFSLEGEEPAYDGQAYIDKIIELLDEAVVAFQAGEAQKAKALAVEAYLENYEFIERDIEEDDPELMLKIELDLREELVDMIEQGRPASEVQDHVDGIKADLETARAVVVPEFPLPVVAIVATMALAVAATRFKGIRLKR